MRETVPITIDDYEGIVAELLSRKWPVHDPSRVHPILMGKFFHRGELYQLAVYVHNYATVSEQISRSRCGKILAADPNHL